MITTYQIVQHLKPGGIETLALDLIDFCESNENAVIVSLEGTYDEALSNWPKLNKYKDKLIFLDKKAGIKISTFLKLFKLFYTTRPHAVHTQVPPGPEPGLSPIILPLPNPPPGNPP